ncbi:hypothetical protein DSO57_1030792 [Entomophthora muscae]|uniref:Uncharacterized protein n=1 Tax=Entomophthora muscae TaxID=34485 RepID=A0ACC2S2Y2_9FUNG|nr:hypothetical protein DSO57_1030792 [Entomophthora muscae]
MKPRSYSYAQERDSYNLSKGTHHTKKPSGHSGTYPKKRSVFSSSDISSDRNDNSSNASPILRSNRYRERAPIEKEYVVVRGSTGGKAVLRSFTASSYLTISPPLRPSNHRPKVGRSHTKHCQSCRQVVKKSSVGSAHLRCRGCSGLWHRACGPQILPQQTFKNFLCLTCQASAPPRKTHKSKRASRNNLPVMEACAILDVWSSSLQNSDVDIMGDDDEEKDEHLPSTRHFVSVSIPSPPAQADEDVDICLTCDGDCSCHPYSGPAKALQNNVATTVSEDEMEMSSSPEMHEAIDCVSDSSYNEEDLELDIMSHEPSHPSFAMEVKANLAPPELAAEVCLDSSPQDIPSSPAPLGMDSKRYASLPAHFETECKEASYSSPAFLETDYDDSSSIPLETEYEEDNDSSLSEDESLGSVISEIGLDNEGSPEPFDIEESFHMRQREEQYLIQQVMSATCNWDSQDEDDEDESLPNAIPSPKPRMGSGEEFLSPSHPWYPHKPVFLSDLLEEPPKDNASIPPSPSLSNDLLEYSFKDPVAKFLHPPIFKGNEKIQRPRSIPLQLPNSTNYLPLASLGKGVYPPVGEDVINQAVNAVQMLSLEDLVDVDQLGCSSPVANSFDDRSAAALARWDKFPVTGFQHHSFKLPAAIPSSHPRLGSHISSDPSLPSGTSEFTSSCATPSRSFFSPSIQSNSPSPQHSSIGIKACSSLAAGWKTKASSPLPGRLGIRQRKREKRALTKRCSSTWDQFLGVDAKVRRTTPVASSNGVFRVLSSRARQAARALAEAARHRSRQEKQSQNYEYPQLHVNPLPDV